jgi:lactoylglutathione lyase
MQLRLLVIRSNDIKTLAGFYSLLGFSFEYHRPEKSPFHYSATIDKTVLEIYPLPINQKEADLSLRLGFTLDDFDLEIESLK